MECLLKESETGCDLNMGREINHFEEILKQNNCCLWRRQPLFLDLHTSVISAMLTKPNVDFLYCGFH